MEKPTRKKVPRLSELVNKSIAGLLHQMKINEYDKRSLIRIQRLTEYIQQLPRTLVDELFFRFLCFYGEGMSAWHVALFMYEGQTKLKLWFEHPNVIFDLKFLLDMSGHKMDKLQELQLPPFSSISAKLCERLSSKLINLQKLVLIRVMLEDNAMRFLANFSLQELDVNYTPITDHDIGILCKPDSKARLSLRVLKIRFTIVRKLETAFLVLKSMPRLEYFQFDDYDLFQSLPIDMRNQQFNLKILELFNTCEDIESVLETASITCPAVTTLMLSCNCVTPSMLDIFANFNSLSTLRLGGRSGELLGNFPVASYTAELPSLNCLEVYYWSCSNNLLAFLEKCPNLETLKMQQCEWFNDSLAGRMAQTLMNSKLRNLLIIFCNSFGMKGIAYLLEIPSLYKCKIAFRLPDGTNRFDARPLKILACERNVNLNISFVAKPKNV